MLFDLEDAKKTSSTEPTLLLIDIAGYVNRKLGNEQILGRLNLEYKLSKLNKIKP